MHQYSCSYVNLDIYSHFVLSLDYQMMQSYLYRHFADLRKIYKSCQNMLLKHLRIEASHHEPAISHRRTQRK